MPSLSSPLLQPVALVPAALGLAFDPVVRIGDLDVRWQALALAAVIAAALLWFVRRVHGRGADERLDDVAFVVLGAIPGAVVGGRLVHGLVFHAAYASEPAALLDLGRGSLSLAGAVLGGALTAAYVCRQLGRPVGSWADAAALPLLLAVGGGKLAMLLGGAGQGMPWDGRGAVAFLGPGPWGSADAATPAYPTQFLEGSWVLLGIPVVAYLERRWAREGRTGRGLVLLAGVGWWLVGRVAFAAWWRDRTVIGPWGWEAIVALLGLVLVVAALLVHARSTGRASDQGPYRGATRSA